MIRRSWRRTVLCLGGRRCPYLRVEDPDAAPPQILATMLLTYSCSHCGTEYEGRPQPDGTTSRVIVGHKTRA